MRGTTPSEQADDGIDASVCARSGKPALPVIPRPSAAHRREDAARSNLMAAGMGTGVRVSNYQWLVPGIGAGGCSHPQLDCCGYRIQCQVNHMDMVYSTQNIRDNPLSILAKL